LRHECFHGLEVIKKAAPALIPAAYPDCFAKWLSRFQFEQSFFIGDRTGFIEALCGIATIKAQQTQTDAVSLLWMLLAL
jgi:hypothetical protein